MGMVEFVDFILGIPRDLFADSQVIFVDYMEKRENVVERESLS